MSELAPAWWPGRLAFLRAPLDAEGVARLADDVVPCGSVRLRGPLDGGMETAVHSIDLIDRQGRVTRAVLKRRQDFADDGRLEWAALHAARPAEVRTPEPVAFDPDGRWFGVPALVMSRLPGVRRPNLGDNERELGQLARALAALHDCDAAALVEPEPRWRRGVPDDASGHEEAVWARISEASINAGPAGALVHGDFHPGNALWDDGRLAGVIDWENGARGWPAEDLAKCRWYLHLLRGPVAADRFLAAYETEVGGEAELVALCDAAYAVGVLRRAEQRAFFMRRSGFQSVTAESILQTTRSIIERAVGVSMPPSDSGRS